MRFLSETELNICSKQFDSLSLASIYTSFWNFCSRFSDNLHIIFTSSFVNILMLWETCRQLKVFPFRVLIKNSKNVNVELSFDVDDENSMERSNQKTKTSWLENFLNFLRSLLWVELLTVQEILL